MAHEKLIIFLKDQKNEDIPVYATQAEIQLAQKGIFFSIFF